MRGALAALHGQPCNFVDHAKNPISHQPWHGAQDNRDKRVELLQRYARKFFPATKYLDYALRVEAYTLTKAANLVMNVDVRPSCTFIPPGPQHSYGQICLLLCGESLSLS